MTGKLIQVITIYLLKIATLAIEELDATGVERSAILSKIVLESLTVIYAQVPNTSVDIIVQKTCVLR